MGAEARNSLFAKGRDEGLEVALRLLEAGGDAESIRKEIRFRKRTGISMGLSHEELEQASHRIKVLTVGTLKIAMAAAIADSYGFGSKRIRKALDAFDKLTEYMANGWLYWLDMVDELKARHHIDLSIEEGDMMLRHYSRPAPQDLWEEADLVAEADWKNILLEAGLSQGVSKDGHPCVFDGKVPLIEYKDGYEQVDAFCMIQGMLLERSRRAEKEADDGEGKESPPQEEEKKQAAPMKQAPKKPAQKGKRHGRKKR